MKEMVGGCCVCSDERGWPENPLVYCDGQGCTVAVHQACYGIVTVPTGPWYCRKCESQERSTKVRCELCPSKDGALKRTDNSGWAHVVCALYIPEVRFGNVTTMEPIILQLIPPERFSKCYICEEVLGKGNPRATIGACMQCNKERCRMQFHVTCAQSLGLLCEEAGNYLDNVKYCGYCQYHYRKLLKRPNIKTIPAYKPVPAVDSPSSDSSPEKDAEKAAAAATTTTTATPTTSTVTKRKSSSSKSSTAAKASTSSAKSGVVEPPKSSSNKLVDKLANNKVGPSNSAVKKFSADLLQDIATIQAAAAAADKVPPTDKILITAAIETPENPPTPDTDKDSVKSSGSKKRKAESRTPTPAPPEVIPEPEPEKKVKADEEPEVSIEDKPIVGPNGVLINPQVTLEPLFVSNDGGGLKITYEKQDSPVSTPEERPRSQSVDNKSERPTRGKKRTSTGNTPTASTSTALPKRASRSQTASSNLVPTIQGAFSSITQARDSHVKESPPSSPEDTTQRKRKNGGSNSNSVDSKDVKMFQNGINAPHMLGNQLNPNSHMAQKMSDHLNSELEAHSIFSPDAMPASSLVGPQLHNRIIASARGNNSNQSNGSVAGGFSSMLGVGASGTIPQTLDQLLERQWEQGSQFLMEQAQHFDIASLLSCLHQLRAENLRLEEHVSSLLQRRDHLLAVNARLAIPLSTQLPISASIAPIQTTAASSSRPTFTSSSTNGPVENGVDSYPRNSETFNRTTSSQPSPTSFNRTNSSQPSPRQSSSYVGQQGVLRGNRGQYSSYPQGSIPVVTSQAQHPQVNVRRDNEMHHQMGTSSSKQS